MRGKGWGSGRGRGGSTPVNGDPRMRSSLRIILRTGINLRKCQLFHVINPIRKLNQKSNQRGTRSNIEDDFNIILNCCSQVR